ncbi:MAG: hypothetical protein IJM42_08140 [Synergistes sp.]|nr:hypothetical protein [Clostridia bacterium]MBQ9882561.1 hypothetical protein [Synergistes sp.]
MQGIFYLGANTPGGFFSYYDELDRAAPARKIIIKGGPGTGKSSFMKKAVKAAQKEGGSVEQIVCSSDPDSLDAIVIEERGVAFVDGTAPHTVDPVYPGAYDEIINLGGFWNRQKLTAARSEIEALSGRISKCFNSAYCFLAAAKGAHDDMGSLISEEVDVLRMERTAARIAKKEFKKKDDPACGAQSSRFISGITPLGVKHYLNENLKAFERVYAVLDTFKTGGPFFSALSRAATKAGYNVINCYCPMSPAGFPEHVIVEELSLAFVSVNSFHDYSGDVFRRINLDRYVSEEARRKNRQKIKFDMSLYRALTARAVEYVKEAKSLHDELEKIYTGAMDFKKINAMSTKIIAEITV